METGPHPAALVAIVPLAGGMVGIVAATVTYLAGTSFGRRAVWLWPLIVAAIACVPALRRPDTVAENPSVFTTLAVPLCFAVLWGVPAAWRSGVILERAPRVGFGGFWPQVVLATVAGTAVLALLLFVAFRFVPGA